MAVTVLARWEVTVIVTSLLIKVGETITAVVVVSVTYRVVRVCVLSDIVYAAVLTGAMGGKVAEVADLCIKVPSRSTPRIQEMCMHLGHTLCEIVERDVFPEFN